METLEDTTPDLVHQAEPAQISQGTPPYSPIDSESGDIRLLELAPGGFDDPILITLVESNLSASEERPYEALSYVWGTTISSEKVLLDGVPVEVTSNLDCALRHIRSKLTTRVLWIDALSMNQKDIQERNHQVRIMGRIYSTADKVVIWLGPVDSGDVYLKATLDVMQFASVLDAGGSQTVNFMRIAGLIKGLHVRTYGLCVYDAVYQIVTRPWFNRVWVVQELALSKTADVHVGEYTISWTMFQQIVAALLATLHLSATDPRDKIFGILGISQLGDFPIQPDYTKSVQRVFLEAMTVLFQGLPSVIYRQVPLHPWRDSLNFTPLRDLPSWVPDLRITSAMYNAEISETAQGALREGNNLSTLFKRPPFPLPHPNLELAFKTFFSADLTQLQVIAEPTGTVTRTSGNVLDDVHKIHDDEVLLYKLRQLFAKTARPLNMSAEVFFRALLEWIEEGDPDEPNALLDLISLLAIDSESFRPISKALAAYMSTIATRVSNRICFITDKQKVGLSYHPDSENGIRPGDVVARLFQDRIFFILRPMDNPTYQMINVAKLLQYRSKDYPAFRGGENDTHETPFSPNTKMSTEEFNALSPEQARQALDVYGLKQYTIV